MRPKGWVAKAKQGLCLIMDGRKDAARKWPRKFTSAKCEGSGLELLPALEHHVTESVRFLVAETPTPTESVDVAIFVPERRNGAILFDVGGKRAEELASEVDELVRRGQEAGTAWPPKAEQTFEKRVVGVCAHESRDFRCKLWGSPLVRALSADDGIDESTMVLKCSHVGEESWGKRGFRVGGVTVRWQSRN